MRTWIQYLMACAAFGVTVASIMYVWREVEERSVSQKIEEVCRHAVEASKPADNDEAWMAQRQCVLSFTHNTNTNGATRDEVSSLESKLETLEQNLRAEIELNSRPVPTVPPMQ